MIDLTRLICLTGFAIPAEAIRGFEAYLRPSIFATLQTTLVWGRPPGGTTANFSRKAWVVSRPLNIAPAGWKPIPFDRLDASLMFDWFRDSRRGNSRLRGLSPAQYLCDITNHTFMGATPWGNYGQFSRGPDSEHSEDSEDGLVQVSLKLKDFAVFSPWA